MSHLTNRTEEEKIEIKKTEKEEGVYNERKQTKSKQPREAHTHTPK